MFQVVDRPKLYEQVVEQIKNMIVQGIYKKGDLLPSEKELIEMTGVSRITVREALRLLNEAGVIETHKGKGSFVTVDSNELFSGDDSGDNSYREQFIDSTNARILLEPSVVREIAATATDEELKQIAASISVKGYEDGEFHRLIIAAAHNPILLQWFDQLNSMETSPTIRSLVPPVRQKSVAAKIMQHHQNIGDALTARNGEFAYFYMKEHLVFIRDIYEEYFKVFY